MRYELSQRVGNYKTGKVGRVASAPLKGAHGEFDGFVILTDHYGYEVWEEATLVALPPDLLQPGAPPAA